MTIASGWVLALGRHTVTAVVRAAGAVSWKHISSFHRFFSKSWWQLDELRLTLVRLLDPCVPKGEPVLVFGRVATVKVLLIDALWYVAAGSERVRLVVVRDFPGHKRADVLVCTEPSIEPAAIIENFCRRWSTPRPHA